MMWVKFTDRFPWKPKPAVTQIYPAGTVANVPKACGEAAIKAGKAEAVGKDGTPLAAAAEPAAEAVSKKAKAKSDA